MASGSTSVEDLLTILRERRRRLPFEIGAFVALQATEELLERPRDAHPRTIYVLEDGTVDLGRAAAADEGVALASLHALLAGLLAAAGEGVPQMMLDLLERPAAGAQTSLARWRDELEASLIPLNRSAAKRVLARTLRDLRRDAGTPRSGSSGDPDADLDALLEGREPPVAEEPIVLPAPDSERARLAPARPKTSPDGAPRRSIFSDSDGEAYDVLREEPSASSSMGLKVAIAAIIVAALGAVAFALRPHETTESRDPDGSRERTSVAPAFAPEPEPARGEIAVEVEPEGAIVRLFVGRAPTLVDDVPVGVAQELVAIADDGTAVRYVVAADAAYRDVDGLPELVVRIDGTPVAADVATGGTDLRPETMGRPSGRLGRLRVDATLAGAKIYRTVGYSPLARLVGWPPSRGAELLVSAARYASERVLVAPSDFRDERGEPRASAHVVLTASSVAPAP